MDGKKSAEQQVYELQLQAMPMKLQGRLQAPYFTICEAFGDPQRFFRGSLLWRVETPAGMAKIFASYRNPRPDREGFNVYADDPAVLGWLQGQIDWWVKLTGKVQPASVSLDGTPDYDGWVYPDRHWTGFAVPYFTRETAERILRDLQELPPGDWLEWSFDEEADCFTITDLNGDQTDIVEGTIIRTDDGGVLNAYAIGGFSWTWFLNDPTPKRYHASAGYGWDDVEEFTVTFEHDDPRAILRFLKRQIALGYDMGSVVEEVAEDEFVFRGGIELVDGELRAVWYDDKE